MSDDLISRQAAIKALTQLRFEAMANHEDVQKIWECEDAIVQCPSTQPEKKTGVWAYRRSGIYYCSICGYDAMSDAISPYCPNCGAKMEV